MGEKNDNADTSACCKLR